MLFDDGVDAREGADAIESAIKDKASLPAAATVETGIIEPTKFADQYNLLLAVYGDKDTGYEALEAQATVIASQIANRSEIESAETIPVVETFISPTTGQPSEQQTSINKVGIAKDGAVQFYPAVSIGVTKPDGIDDIELSNAVTEAIATLANNADLSDVNITITADFATTINQQISSLQSSLLGGIFAVLIVTLLLISWRVALVIALFIPTVVAAAFSGLNLLDYSLNTITLFALILTLGLFVDDSTIIAESIDAHRKDRVSRKTAIMKAVSRVGMASFAGTLTTIIVFTPMLYVTGILGEFIRLLPITVILALTLSFVISIILVPFLSRLLILGTGKKLKWLDRLSILVPVEQFLSERLARLPLLNKKPNRKSRLITTGAVGLSILAIVGAGIFASRIGLDIFPQAKDSNVLQAQLDFAPNTRIVQAEAITDQLDKRIAEIVGDNLAYVTYLVADTQSATIEIGLKPYTERKPTSLDIIAELETRAGEVAGIAVQYGQRDAGPPAQDFPFQMHLYDANPQQQADSANLIADFLRGKEITIGRNATTTISEVSIAGISLINRSEHGRFVAINAKFDNPDASSAAVIETQRLIQEKFNDQKLMELGLSPDALDFDVGQESQNVESFNSIIFGLIVALVLMYGLLVILFNSFSQPILIFMAIPFSLFGVFFGLWATDNSLSFFVMLGLLGLIGIVVNNSILLTEYANQERQAGADRHTAISRAVKDRFRPLVTTTATTVFALLPLALTDPFWQPLAFTLIFGMVSSAALIIIAFPYYYLFFERIRSWKNRHLPSLK